MMMMMMIDDDDDDDDDDDAEIRAVLGSRTADADSIGQRVSGESDIRAHLSRVRSTESLLLAGQRISAETRTETAALPADHQQSVELLLSRFLFTCTLDFSSSNHI